jgi:membrane protein DedA with SNARE-associated domain
MGFWDGNPFELITVNDFFSKPKYYHLCLQVGIQALNPLLPPHLILVQVGALVSIPTLNIFFLSFTFKHYLVCKYIF